MSMMRTLSDGWTLTDGILDPLPIGSPKPVREALVDCGVLAGDFTDLQTCLAQEWVWLRSWRYELSFPAPEEDDERVELIFEQLDGAGQILLNGHRVAGFTGGEVRAELTQWLEDENKLLVCFEPPVGVNPANPLVLGISGEVKLHTTSFVTVSAFRVDTSAREEVYHLNANLLLTAHAAGRYTFEFLVTRSDEIAVRASFEEHLKACEHALSFPIELDRGVHWDGVYPENTTYDVRLTVTRAGVGCETLRTQAAFVRQDAHVRALYRETVICPYDKDKEECTLLLAKELGVNTLIPRDSQKRFAAPHTLKKGFLSCEPEQRPVVLDVSAPTAPVLDDDGRWLPPSPAWRYLNAKKIDLNALKTQYGEALVENNTALSRLLNFRQAEAIRLLAAGARLRNAPAVASMLFPQTRTSVCSSIVEADGALKPAFAALQQAWRPVYAFAEPPQHGYLRPGEMARLPIFLVSDLNELLPVTVSVSCLTVSGRVHAGTSFAALTDRSAKLGEFALTPPEGEPLLILRVRIESDAQKTQSDIAVALSDDGETPLRPFLRLPGAKLILENSMLRNAGDCAAIGVFAPGKGGKHFYGALLPGESIEIDESRAASIRSINGETPVI